MRSSLEDLDARPTQKEGIDIFPLDVIRAKYKKKWLIVFSFIAQK